MLCGIAIHQHYRNTPKEGKNSTFCESYKPKNEKQPGNLEPKGGKKMNAHRKILTDSKVL